MISNNYFYIDGSSLIAQIKAVHKSIKSYKDKKLNPVKLIQHFSKDLANIGMEEFKRAVFYFPLGGEREVERYIQIDKLTKTKSARDIVIKFCGRKIKGSKAYDEFLDNVPLKFREKCDKSEKGIDIEICCDALILAATDKLERLILLTNDSDFIPLLKSLKSLGTNVGLIHLTGERVNKELDKECDSCDFLGTSDLKIIFAS